MPIKILLVCLLIISCKSKSIKDVSFTIDSTIKQKAIEHFKTIGKVNEYDADYGYYLDSLRLTVEPYNNIGIMIHPVLYWINFKRKSNNQFLFACGHTRPVYKLNKSDEGKQCIEVPLILSKLILSSMPDTNTKVPVYGYLKFKSKRFYNMDKGGDDQEQTEYENYFVAKYQKVTN